jgi:hypothetical protein
MKRSERSVQLKKLPEKLFSELLVGLRKFEGAAVKLRSYKERFMLRELSNDRVELVIISSSDRGKFNQKVQKVKKNLKNFNRSPGCLTCS